MPDTNGSFVPTTQIWDVSDIYSTDVKSPEFKELIVRMYQQINTIALVLNTKDTGYYPLFEMVNSQLWFPNTTESSGTTPQSEYRQVIRKVLNAGTLPNNATATIAHGITMTTQSRMTRLYGVATDPVNLTYIPLPFAHPTAANNISLSADGTNVYITTGSNRTTYTVCYVVIEYIKY